MPFINAKVSVPVSLEQEERLKDALGEAIALLKKSENYLMVNIEGDQHLYFGTTNDREAAFFDVSLLHSAPRECYEALTKKLCAVCEDVLGIDGDRVYVKFEETENWGFNGFMF